MLDDVGIVFLHQRRAVIGQDRIVLAEVAAGQAGDEQQRVYLSTTVIRPDALGSPQFVGRWWSNSPTLQTLDRTRPLDEQALLRVFAGQPDPVDASHFSAEYQIGDARGRIDGWLQADDSVTLQIGIASATRPATSSSP